MRSYERAVDLYADQGFFNNAIALCGKILRVNPGRTQTYLKLAQLHARKNVVIEAKRNLIEFLERMNALGQLDQAFTSVKEFADQFSGSQEIRLMLVELLRASSREDEALEQLEKLAGEIEARGERPGPGRTGSPSTPRRRRNRPAAVPAATEGLVFLDTGVDLPARAAARRCRRPGPRLPPTHCCARRSPSAPARRRDGRRAGARGAGSGTGPRGGSRGHRTGHRPRSLIAQSPPTSSSSASRSRAWDQPQDDLVDAHLLDTTADDLIVSVIDDSMVIDDSI